MSAVDDPQSDRGKLALVLSELERRQKGPSSVTANAHFWLRFGSDGDVETAINLVAGSPDPADPGPS